MAALLIGHTGAVSRSCSKDHYASYNATVPIEASSGPGRAYYQRKLAEHKSKKEALRALKRHVSDAVYRQLALDANIH